VTVPEVASACPRCGRPSGGGAFCSACGASLTGDFQSGAPSQADTNTIAEPRQIGRFRILSRIGSGGFATVYRAEDSELGREVAVKILHPHLTQDEDFIRRFHAEARAAARLRHPNIVRIYDAALTENGSPYLVMELLEGRVLADLITRGTPMSRSAAASLVTQLASALDYLHGNGLIHRDLKPSNIMVDAQGLATLMDFGVARWILEQTHFTLPGQLFGTPTYMAPEQIAGDETTAAADIYALGILAYELLSGQPPFEGNTQRVLYAQAHEPPPPLELLPPEARAAIESALEKDPGKRPGSASDFSQALARALGERPAGAPPTEATFAGAAPGDADATLLVPQSLPNTHEATLAGAPETTIAGPAETQSPAWPSDLTRASGMTLAGGRTLAGDPTLAGTVNPAGSARPSPAEKPALKTPGDTFPPARAATNDSPRRSPVPVPLLAGLAVVVLATGLLAFALLGHRSPKKAAVARPSAATAAAVAPLVGSNAGAAPAANVTMRVTAPANGSTVNSTVVVSVEQSGALIRPATDNDPNAAHFHYFIDRDPVSVLKPGQPIPSGQPDIVHTAAASLTIPDLKPGQHNVWVVLAHTDHTPYSPNIQSQVTFTVVNAADTVATLAGSGAAGVADGAGAAAQFSNPNGVAVDGAGNVYVADTGNSRIRKIAPNGSVTTIAGSGGGQFDGPRGVAVDKSGNIYVADTGNNRIRKITPDGTVTTLAGSDSPGLGGGGLADGVGAQAQFRLPVGIAVDASGNVYVADTGNNRIRKISPDGRVVTLAGSGTGETGGFADGPGVSARFNAPRGVAAGAGGTVYVADTLNQRIRKVAADGTVSTLAGSGDQGTSNGATGDARFSSPDGISADPSGAVYISDNSSFRIREIAPSGIVFDVAGTAKEGFADGPPATAQFDFPTGIAADGSGKVYVADANNNRVRVITLAKAGR